MKLADFTVILIGVLLNAAAQLGLKRATHASGPIQTEWPALITSMKHVFAEPTFWAALTCYGVSVLVWVVGLSRVPVNQAYPLLSLGYIVNAFFAWLLLGEMLSAQRMIGICVVIAGVALISRS
jgi:drug/metabolite transporter (DMT)-like permease